ncbi:MAG: FIST C-terminal domain-containing protein, partial [Bacteroidales bacterium]|nr:FIST C-terminal domain-containing protein [Bacteroidales bacterium]
MKFAVGHSDDIDSLDAIHEILDQCKLSIENKKPICGFLFMAIDHEFQVVLNEIFKIYPDIKLIGCTTDGEFSSHMGFTEDGIVLAFLMADNVKIHQTVAKSVSKGLQSSIKEAISLIDLDDSAKSKICITFPTSLTVSGDLLLSILKKELDTNIDIFGGTAADQWRFETNYQFYNNEVLSDSVPIMVLEGDFEYSLGVKSGWEPIGDKDRVTKVQPGLIERIGNRTAVEFYEHYLGANLDTLGEYPLAVFTDENSSEFYLRAISVINDESGSLAMIGDIPENALVQITHATRDNVLEGTQTSVEEAFKSYNGSDPSAIICFSCAGRKLVLGTRVEEESKILSDTIPDIPFLGFYSYGEISPMQKGKPTRLHNETIVSLVLGQ